jgi:hypothetical protein
MDLKLRLAALANLVPVENDEVERRLLAELNRVEGVLQNGTDYEEVSAALKTLAVLAPRFHARVMPMLVDFVRSVPTRALTQGGEPIPASWRKYRSASHLIREAIDVPHTVRFVHTNRLLDFLLELWDSDDEEVRGKAERTLEALAEFDLNLFYGERGLGARPQTEIVAYFANFQDGSLFECANVILKMLRNVLSPSVEGHTWTYSSVTISRGDITAVGGVGDMRAAAIALLKRMYTLDDSVRYRKRVLDTLGAATHRERPSSDADTSAMFDRDAVDVLNFLRDRVGVEELQLVQAIEHDAYWNYYHAASTQVAEAALGVRDAIERRAEYKIYKQLIGFEGIHEAWEELKSSETAWDYSDDKRQQAAARYVDEISDDNYAVWRDRILEFSRTRSDDMAAFPVYYEFLKSIGQKRSRLALELVRDHQEVMDPFLVALLRGLWSSERKADAEIIALQWIAGHTHLAKLAKSLNVDDQPRLDLLARVISEADRVGDTSAIVEAMGVAAHQYARGHAEAKAVFMRGMRDAARHHDARWANVVWFNRDFRKLVEAMEPAERAEVLASMAPLTKVNYQAEEVLYAIGQYDPQALLNFLMARVRAEQALDMQRRDTDADEGDRFEAIPYSPHTLNKLLAKMPEALLSAVRHEFKTETAGMFPYSGSARLIKAAFPNFEKPLQDHLLTYVRSGKPADIDFVVAVLRAYGGAVPILPICKEIIKVVPERSSPWDEVAAAFESTGVVSGEYGMVHAFEAKREEIAPWMDDDNPKVRAFAAWLTENLDQQIVHERQRADESLALRKHKYGVGKDEA